MSEHKEHNMLDSKKFIVAVSVVAIVFVCGIWLGFVLNDNKIATERKLSINQEVEVRSKAEPDTFKAKIRIQGSNTLRALSKLNDEQSESLVQTFNAVSRLIKANKEICSGGSYGYSPEVYYERNRRKVGFSAYQEIVCSFGSEQKSAYEKLLKAVGVEVGRNALLTLPILPIQAIITPEQIDRSTQEMRTELIKKAQGVAKQYSKALKQNCNIEDISFQEVGNTKPQARNGVMAMSAETPSSKVAPNGVSLPTTKEEDLVLSANFIIGCMTK